MAGFIKEGFTNQLEYYMVTQHLIFRAHLHDSAKTNTKGCYDASSKMSLYVADYQRSLRVWTKIIFLI